MADIREENNVFGGVEFNNENGNNVQEQASNGKNLPVKQGFWTKFKNFWFQEIDWNKEIKVELTPYQQKVEKKVELTPYQQKVENEINEFLHQEITWEKVHDFLFQEITFGKKKTEA